jgi:hypothetical protein
VTDRDRDDLREPKGRVVRADFADIAADRSLKIEQRRWEPWKALSAAFGAGVAVASGLFALAAWTLAHFVH